MMRPNYLLVLAAACALVGCGGKSGSKPENVFPGSDEISSWSKVGATRTFEASDLWKYIDGDAEKYIAAGVQRTLTADYRYKGSTEAVVDVHLMASPDGPRKIMDSEPAMDSQPVAVGEVARLYRGSLIFRKGRYLVRLVAYDQPPEIEKALVDLARGIEKKL